MSDALRSAVEGAGHALNRTIRANAPERWSTLATDAELRALNVSGDIKFMGRAGEELALTLPTLASVLSVLPRVPQITRTELSWFDPSSAAWLDVPDINGLGAYRTSGYSRSYFLVTQDDLDNRLAAVADAFLAKHAASVMMANRSLIGYSAADRELITPLGSGLPGQYERAVVLSTQEPPIRRRGYLVYRNVSPHMASRIKYLLEN